MAYHFDLSYDYTETVDIEWDPLKTKFEKLLDIFWQYHDPTAACARQVRLIMISIMLVTEYHVT